MLNPTKLIFTDEYWSGFWLFLLGLVLGLSTYQIKGVLLLRLCTDILGDVTDGSQEIYLDVSLSPKSGSESHKIHGNVPTRLTAESPAKLIRIVKKYKISVTDHFLWSITLNFKFGLLSLWIPLPLSAIETPTLVRKKTNGGHFDISATQLWPM